MSTLGRAFKLDQNGDLKLTENDAGFTEFDIVEGPNEVAQALVIRLRTRRGEDPLNPDTGLPIPQIMGIFDPPLLNTILRTEVSKDGRVASINNVESGFETRENRRTRSVQALGQVQLIDNSAVNIVERFIL